MLLLLDTCEHVIDAAARLVAVLLREAPGVNVLTTSREPLGVVGEHEYRLGPLSGPPPSSELSAAEAAAFPAIQLLVERVSAVVQEFALTDANAPLVADICRRLDGLPLAIEFAAPRVEVLGIEGVAAHLSDSLPALGGRRRTAIPRHRTMRAVLDWSYGLLSEDEQLFFRTLGIFAGGFVAEAAAAVLMDSAEMPCDAIDGLADLVMKSLVLADVSGATPRFRLLDTTRAYALERLDESGERERIARRHAEYYRDLFERAETESEMRPTTEWLADYGPHLDNMRAALDWAFTPDGDAAIGVALTTAAVPLWMHLSLMDECRSRVVQALAAGGAGSHRDAFRRMKLYAALATSLIYTRGHAPETVRAWSSALAAAEELDDTEHRLEALYGLWNCRATSGNAADAIDFARQFQRLAVERSRPTDILIGDRMLGSTLHFSGEQAAARHHLESMLSAYVPPVYRTAAMRHQFDQRIVARSLLARVCWLQGFPDHATTLAATALEQALATGHANAVCYALVEGACPVALFTGDLALARRLIEQLLDRSARHRLTTWQVLGLSLEGELLIRSGDTATGLPRLRAALEEVKARRLLLRLPALLGVLAAGYLLAGHVSEAAAAIGEGIAYPDQTEQYWGIAELLRIRGEILRLQGAPAAGTAEHCFRQALERACRQGALAWQLRAATSLARLLSDQQRTAEAIACLKPIYDRFTEGFGTADLVAAKQLLSELSVIGDR
jgi:predicted ATPase